MRELHVLMREWMDLPHMKPNLNESTRKELIKQLSLYKRGSVARCANKKKGGKLKQLEKDKERMHVATEKAEQVKLQLGIAQNLIGHIEANADIEARVRQMLRSKQVQQSDTGAPLEVLADDVFDDLDLSLPSQEDQFRKGSSA